MIMHWRHGTTASKDVVKQQLELMASKRLGCCVVITRWVGVTTPVYRIPNNTEVLERARLYGFAVEVAPDDEFPNDSLGG